MTATLTYPDDFSLLGQNLYLSVITYDDHPTGPPTPCVSPSCIEDVGVGIHVQVLPADIPTVSAWGMVAMTLLMLTAGTLALSHSRVVRKLETTTNDPLDAGSPKFVG